MSLESANYVSDLDSSNPDGTDLTSQGDDHIRLLKAALKATFPGASKAFRFPNCAVEATSSVSVSFPADQNKLIAVSALAAARTVSLPDPASGGTVNEDGFSVIVVKTDTSVNAVTIDGSGSQTINGALTLALTEPFQIAVLTWSKLDVEWYATVTLNGGKYIGETFEYCGTTAPALSLLCYGQAISRTTYAALFARIGEVYGVGNGATTFNVPDDRGRVTAGQDDMGGTSADRLTGVTDGINGDTLGATGGLETTTIVQANLPDVNLNLLASKAVTDVTLNQGSFGAASGVAFNALTISTNLSVPKAAVTGAVALGGSGTAMNNLPPMIIKNKCIFAGI